MPPYVVSQEAPTIDEHYQQLLAAKDGELVAKNGELAAKDEIIRLLKQRLIEAGVEP